MRKVRSVKEKCDMFGDMSAESEIHQHAWPYTHFVKMCLCLVTIVWCNIAYMSVGDMIVHKLYFSKVYDLLAKKNDVDRSMRVPQLQ